MLDKLVSLLYSRSENLTRRLKRHSPKVRGIVTTKILMRGKNQVIEGGTNFTVSQTGWVVTSWACSFLEKKVGLYLCG